MVGLTILSLVAGSVLWGLNQLSYYAGAARLYTAAQTLAQNQIDLLLTLGPYDPAQGLLPRPSGCATKSILDAGATYYWDLTAAANTCPISATPKTVPIYKDPMNNNQIVSGTIATTVATTPFAVNGVGLDVRQATVKVAYRYGRRDYEVVMETMRTSDK